MQIDQSSLFAMPSLSANAVTKTNFASILGVSKGRISQMIREGLPVEADGRIDVAAGREWVRQNVDPNRRSARVGTVEDAPRLSTAREDRATSEARIAAMKAEERAGNLIDRRATLRAIESRARGERDAWLGWVNRAAPDLALASGGDLAIIVSTLDRLVRDQLGTLASMPIEDLAP